MLKNISQCKFGLSSNFDNQRDKVFTPDFGSMAMLYKEFGMNNDIDLMMQKPQYRDIVNANLGEVPVSSSPNLSDAQLLDFLPSREYDVNELREYANYQAKEYKKNKED